VKGSLRRWSGVLLAGMLLLLSVVGAQAAQFKVGMVTDMGGIDDKSFNATSWKGVQMAIDKLGVQGRYLESQQQTDYAKNLQEFISQNYDLIVTVGFLLGDDTAKFANANPNFKFAIVDFSYDPPIPNTLGLMFATEEAAFLAGYVAAGTTKTGKVATFGGIALPTVTCFMDGFEAGVIYYNQKNKTNVQVLGWNGRTQRGLFVGNFESTEDGRRVAQSLFDEGADIVMPVAGPVGLGSAAAALARGKMIIGVDTDWYESAPEYRKTYLTSVIKKMDIAVYNAIEQAMKGTFKGGIYMGTLANDGVDIAPFHDNDSQVPAKVKADLVQVRKDLIDGKIDIYKLLGR
jgi:basic membrane protein A